MNSLHSLKWPINNLSTTQVNGRDTASSDPERKIESWRRGEHSTKTKNKSPGYEVPKSHTSRLAFIRDLVDKSKTRDVTISDEAMLSRAQNYRQKAFYPDRKKAIRALHTVFCEHVNLVTWQVEISFRNASDAAGLSTTSDAEKEKVKVNPDYKPVVSISRTSRAVRDMIDMGWIVARGEDQVWDKEAGQWIDKYYEATILFFMATGITEERVEKQRNERLGFIKKNHLKFGYSEKQAGKLSITQMKADRKIQWRRAAFERRCTELARTKLSKELRDKERTEQRAIATKRVLDFLGDDLHKIKDPRVFKDLVNKEIASLRKFTGAKPPPH